MEKKAVIIINGKSGVGKDSLIEIVSREFRVRNVSSVDVVKESAMVLGWDGVKDGRGRRLLIDLKNAAVRYGDLPTQHMVDAYKDFVKSDDEFMFIHIREIPEIKKLVKHIPCKTLLVTREMPDATDNAVDNAKSARVSNYKYDYKFANDKPLEESGKEFIMVITSTGFFSSTASIKRV